MKKTILFLTLIVLSTLSTIAQTAEEIIQSYVEANGGSENFNRIQTYKMNGIANSNGMEFPMTILQKGKTKFKSFVNFQGIEIVQPAATDGKVAWSTNVMSMQNEIMEDDAAEAISREAKDFPDALFSYSENAYQIKLGEEEEVKGNLCYLVSLIKPDQLVSGQSISGITDYLIDKSNFLVRKKVQNNALGKLESFLDDYKEVEGFMYPHSIKTEVNGNLVSEVIINSYEINIEIEDSLFLFPE